MPFAFNKEAIKLLISLYEQHSILYNSTDPNYKNKTLKQEEYRKLHAEFVEVYPEADLNDVTKKISNLRTQFFSELNKYKKTILSGAGKTDIYKPNWIFYDGLLFLTGGQPIRTGESNLKNLNVSVDENKENKVNYILRW